MDYPERGLYSAQCPWAHIIVVLLKRETDAVMRSREMEVKLAMLCLGTWLGFVTHDFVSLSPSTLSWEGDTGCPAIEIYRKSLKPNM